jgi:CAAX prenyl protease-like protein
MIHGSMSMPAALAAASTPVRAIWIGMRILGAVLTVPIAEELAFRGFLMRRFVSDDFDSVPFQSVGWMGILGSSFLFGLMHGRQWLIASLTGIVYALVVRKTGRIGDAVAAHAFTNALLAAMVLMFGQWQLW